MNDVLEMTIHIVELTERVGYMPPHHRASPLFELVAERAAKHPELAEVVGIATAVYNAIWQEDYDIADSLLEQLKQLAARLIVPPTPPPDSRDL